ncbi:PTS ascorbate transporter subunit IIC [Wukongibacter baidiensis]|uniref:PTS ascorbate transporter subunit IIC n=1 Tax=Wukongibacter baidiensis TaxID=1723361 RepID=UPI003D7FAE67
MNTAQLFTIIVNKFLAQAPLLLGTIAFIGYILLGRKIYEALSGFIKAYVGFRILQVATGGIVGVFRPILQALRSTFGIDGYVIDPYSALPSAIEGLDAINGASFVGYTMLIAFAINILLVLFRKVTKIRTLMITGHVMYIQSAVLLYGLHCALVGIDVKVGMYVTVITGIILGLYWSVFSNLTVEASNHVTGGAGFAIGHQQMLGDWLAYKLGKYFGKPEDSVDDVKLPGWLSMFNDNVVSNTLVMTAFIGIIMLIIGKDAFEYNTGKFTWGTYIFYQTASFPVYVTILLTGVRMFVAELTASFEGISNKILPGSVPAVDCAVIFGFAPGAVTYGFIFGLLGQLVAIGILILIKSPVLILTGFIPVFFDNATIAVYANKSGGKRAAAIMPFCSGLVQVFGSAIVLSLGYYSLGFMGSFDWAAMWSPLVYFSKMMGIVAPGIAIVVMLVIPQLQYRRYKNKDNYFTVMMDEKCEA